MFSAVMRFIGRLSVGRKLILIYALDLSAVIFVSGILISEKFIAIDFARKEVVGNQYIAVVRDTLVGLHGGSALPSAEKLRAAETAYGGGMDSHALAEELAALLEAPTGRDLRLATRAGQALIQRIGNQSNLILDPDLDSYYTMSLIVLRFPELFELIGLIEGKTEQLVRAPRAAHNQLQTEYLILEGRLDAIDKGIDADFAEAIAANHSPLKARMIASRRQLREAINTYRGNAHRIAIDNVRGAKAPDMASAAQALLAQQETAWTTAEAMLGELLKSRIETLFERMWIHLGTAAALLLLILSVVYFVARQIVLPVTRLAKVADQVRASGNYELRAQWDSGDELGRLVNGFNVMLEQLNHSRLSEQEMAASTRAAAAQRELLEAIPIPMVVTAIPHHEVLHSNGPAQDWIEGYSTDPWLTGLTAPARVRFFQQLSDLGAANEFEVLWHGAEANSWALISARRLRYQDKDAMLTTFTPINGLKLMEQRLELWAKVFEASSENIMITDAKRRIVSVNRAFCRGSGYEEAEVIGQLPNLLRSDRHPDDFIDDIWRLASLRGSWQGEVWLQRKSGEEILLRTVVNAVRDGHGEITHFIAVAHDISEHKANEQRINHLAHHDALTDLPNRSLCIERLRMSMQQAQRQHCRVGVLFIDLDRFKNINDSLGHHIGDGLLRSVAQRLLAAVRLGDTVSRLGGDEFVVILNGVADNQEIMQIVDHRLIPLIGQAHEVDGAELHVSCSVGIAVYPDDGSEIEALMRNADAAMYQAKSSGRNNAQFFTAQMALHANERMNIENDLRYAVERGELRLHYQPRVDCRSGRLLGTEALVRWQHPQRGLIAPARFIPIAEESGLIVPIGAWIIDQACRQQAAWRDQGAGEIAISINLSAVQLRDPELATTIKSALAARQIRPQLIELELTESLLMEHAGATIELLHKLKALGVSLSVDDFGTGYSSLNYLHRFPIDKLKIDQSFVADMLDDPNDLAITRAIIGLGHTLGLKVVAEGVEHVEQARMLAAAGCDELQGYLFSHPLPADELLAWKAANERSTPH
ncbi:MAG: hypothetical protein H6R17_3280 [Proteobacteria bacterium]|nr:hypothetical protein [Pseudomonadota bacterium]